MLGVSVLSICRRRFVVAVIYVAVQSIVDMFISVVVVVVTIM